MIPFFNVTGSAVISARINNTIKYFDLTWTQDRDQIIIPIQVPNEAEDFYALPLEELQFEQYARLKAAQHEEFKQYPAFISILHRIIELRCPVPCWQGGGNSQCKVRQYVQHKGFKGCWECKDYRKCTLLDGLRYVHPNLDHCLDLIAELGPARWFKKRKERYRWQCKVD